MLNKVIDTDKIETEILLNMYLGDQYETVDDFKVKKINDKYIVELLYYIEGFDLFSSRVFRYRPIGDCSFEVYITPGIENTEEYQYLSMFSLNDLEKLFVVSSMFGNKLTDQVLPDSIRSKLFIKKVELTKIKVKE